MMHRTAAESCSVTATSQLSVLQEIGEHCQVYAPDLRFHGDSDKPKWVGNSGGLWCS